MKTNESRIRVCKRFIQTIDVGIAIAVIFIIMAAISMSSCTSRSRQKLLDEQTLFRNDVGLDKEYTLATYRNEVHLVHFIISSECNNILYYDTVSFKLTLEDIDDTRNYVKHTKSMALNCYELDIKTLVR